MNEQLAGEVIEKAQDSAVVVTRSVHHPLDAVWESLMAPQGAEALLGPGATMGNKGDDWHAHDGTRGVLRSFHPKEQIRFSFHESDDAPHTMVELDLRPEGDSVTNLSLTVSHLSSDMDRDQVRERWEKVLDRVDGACR